MSASFPKYSPFICGGYTPIFDETLGPCVLLSITTKRSRLNEGGSFFRSVEAAHTFPVNDITLTCVVTFDRNEGIDTDVWTVDFSITDPINGTVNITQFEQKFDNDAGSCLLEGPQQLRDKLAAGSPPYSITMPDIDNPSGWSSTSDACLLTSFSSPMLGGVGLPTSGDTGSPPTIRTGPTFSIVYIGFADTAENGNNEEVNELSEWDGTQWIIYPSELYEAGSGSPALCTP